MDTSSLRACAAAALLVTAAVACGGADDPTPLTLDSDGDAGAGGGGGGDPGGGGGGDAGGGGGDAGPGNTTDGSAVSDAQTLIDGGKDATGTVDSGLPCGAGGVCPCVTDDDCEGLCVAKVCAAPTITDGKTSPSLGETDVDCGGALAPGCPFEKKCLVDGDCTSVVCSAAGVCTTPSCRAGSAAGLDTCGAGEPGEVGAAHETCCRSLPLPVRTTRMLDRYEITAGRMRAFIASLGPTSNVRAYAKAYAVAHPGSQLAFIDASFPGLLDVLPDHPGPTGRVPLPVHLGAFPLDPINALDGCYVAPGSYGHATYWQPVADLKPYGIGGILAGKPDGIRKYDKDTLDAKPINCMMPLLMATFCAWDGGELARTRDYNEVWGRHPAAVGTATVYIPWAGLLSVGDFNWRNGHGAACSPAAWPGCVNPQDTYFYVFPTLRPDGLGHRPHEDDTPAIAAPGRFALDTTLKTSASGEGWYDVGGNLMEAAWPIDPATGLGIVSDVCDVSGTPGPGDTACTRRGNPGVLRWSGALPSVALVGYSFEGHARRSEAYLANVAMNEAVIAAGDLKAVTFQYGKVGGRCAR